MKAREERRGGGATQQPGVCEGEREGDREHLLQQPAAGAMRRCGHEERLESTGRCQGRQREPASGATQHACGRERRGEGIRTGGGAADERRGVPCETVGGRLNAKEP
jgi:hypothetical protein